jgi:hypothetical protein
MDASSAFWTRSVANERHGYIPALAIFLEVISTAFFVLRLLARFTRKGLKPGLDDVFLIAGWVQINLLLCSIFAY